MVNKRQRHASFKANCLAVLGALIWFGVLGIFLFPHPTTIASVYVPAKISAKAWQAAQDNAFVDIIVLLNQQADLDYVKHIGDRRDRNAYVFNVLYETAQVGQISIREWLDNQGVTYRSFYIVSALQLQADADLMLAIAKRSDVKRVMTNPQVALSSNLISNSQVKNNDLQSTKSIEWGVARIQAPQVWDLGYRGQGVIVAGQDTGYDWDHPALKNSYRGWDGTTVNHDYVWHDAIHSGGGICGVDSPVPCDDYWHGTHTMGTIVGETDVMQIGVAPEARWMGCRNMSVGVGTPASYTECFEFFIAPYPVSGTSEQGNPAMAPDVINNSWSCPLYEGCDLDHTALLNQVVDNVRAAGIMVVSSAGNHGSFCGTVNEPPAMYDATYTVGATQSDPLDTIATFSSRGTGTSLIKPDISAPGVNVLSCVPGTGYSVAQGTSMASPHVVGAIALIWSAAPGLHGQIQLTEDILNQTSVPRYSTQCGDAPLVVPNNVYGWGRVDAFAAVDAVIGTLTGRISELPGEGLGGVKIRAELSSDFALETTSDALGLYVLRPVSGTYTVTVSKAAYLAQVYTDVRITTSLTTTLSVTMTTYPSFIPLFFKSP